MNNYTVQSNDQDKIKCRVENDVYYNSKKKEKGQGFVVRLLFSNKLSLGQHMPFNRSKPKLS